MTVCNILLTNKFSRHEFLAFYFSVSYPRKIWKSLLNNVKYIIILQKIISFTAVVTTCISQSKQNKVRVIIL